MDARRREADAQTRCAFCGSAFPIVNGIAQLWRAPTGAFFCNEFCADDAEEAIFQGRRKSHFQDYGNLHVQ
jgi:hypothetical protein